MRPVINPLHLLVLVWGLLGALSIGSGSGLAFLSCGCLLGRLVQHVRLRGLTATQIVKDVRRGRSWSQKLHRSVTTKHLSRDMSVRCDTRKHRIYSVFDGYRFLYGQTQKRDRAP